MLGSVSEDHDHPRLKKLFAAASTPKDFTRPDLY